MIALVGCRSYGFGWGLWHMAFWALRGEDLQDYPGVKGRPERRHLGR